MWIASASEDKTLKVWDARTGACLLTFPVEGALDACAVFPDGEHVVAVGRAGVYWLRVVK
jgi:WD40 repeat protein